MILSVGELNENKNHEAVIRAIASATHPASITSTSNSANATSNTATSNNQIFKNIVYVIVGRGKLDEHLRTVAGEAPEATCKAMNEVVDEALHEGSNAIDVRLVGYRNDVADFYDAADIYILPSIREGLNVSLMEAMASGLAVCCSNIRGNTDLIDDKSCLFEPTNVEDIKRAINYAIQHKCTLATKNLEKIRTFDLSSVQNLVADAYIYSESSSPPPKSLI